MVDVARRLCEDNQITVNEIWSYPRLGDECGSRWSIEAARAAPAPTASASPRPRQAPPRSPAAGSEEAGAKPPSAAADPRKPRRAAKPSREEGGAIAQKRK